MCLLSFDWQPDGPVPLTIAANRDEFYVRPTLPLHAWPEAAGGHIVAGQDLQGGGTWMGVHQPSGRVAALTNYRDPHNHRPDAPSRGGIVTAFLNSHASAEAFASALALESDAYNPFNLLLYDGRQLRAFESRHRRHFAPAPGVGAVSNADFNTPWPKLLRLRTAFADAVRQHPPHNDPSFNPALEAALWPLLADTRLAADSALPATGIRLELERALSAEFIHTPGYGTRASSLVHCARNAITTVERSFDERGLALPAGEVRMTVQLNPAA